MATKLGNAIASATDGENNPVAFDVAYPVRDGIAETLQQIRAIHGEEIYLLPMSGKSCGGGIMQSPHPGSGCVVGLQFEAPLQPRVSRGELTDLNQLALDEIIIDAAGYEVCAGASVTLGQLQTALADELGGEYKVLGADLTSYAYAAVGATFMTGGMGPQRRYFSDSVIEVSLFDGEKQQCLRGEEMQGLAGSYGWSGLVAALRCRFVQLPQNEIAFAIPVKQSEQQLADLLQHLSPFAQLDASSRQLFSKSGSRDLILGLEHVTRASMAPMFLLGGDDRIIDRARQLLAKAEAADADELVFVSGYSDRSVDDFLFLLVDDAEADDFSIAGISLEHTEIFNDPELMRQLREAIPYAARNQAPAGNFVFKNHTDATIRLNPERVAESMRLLWRANGDYVEAVESYLASNQGLRGQVLVYGHLNPYGVDPHNRITIASDDENCFIRAREFAVEARATFYRRLADICQQTGSELVGGEKGADSEHAILAAFSGLENAPSSLSAKQALQQARIRQAAKMFSWRALPAYR